MTRFLPLALTAAVLLWFWDNPFVWPLKILVVLFHELGHALAALLTGGEVVSIGLSPDQGGVTHTRGGFAFLVLNAGYLGSLAFGVALLAASRTPTSARRGVMVLAALLAVATLWWVRPVFSFGFGFAAAVTAALAVLARRGGDDLARWVVRTLGVFSALYALWDVRSDVFSSQAGQSDAGALAELTWIPAPVWGLTWLGLGVGALWVTRAWWLPPPSTAAPRRVT